MNFRLGLDILCYRLIILLLLLDHYLPFVFLFLHQLGLAALLLVKTFLKMLGFLLCLLELLDRSFVDLGSSSGTTLLTLISATLIIPAELMLPNRLLAQCQFIVVIIFVFVLLLLLVLD